MKDSNSLGTSVQACRACRGGTLTPVFSLGLQALTGVFPSSSESVPKGNLDLVVCEGCLLVQLAESFPLDILYGENYGYMSSLNASMVDHLRRKAEGLARWLRLGLGDTVLDIGSNDGTFLKFFEQIGASCFGMDPVGLKFADSYSPTTSLIPEFFSAEAYFSSGGRKAKLVTSVSMFYDLENPHDFVSEVSDVLEEDGIWHLEQSYLPSMLRTGSFDTICHEHLEYYSLRSLTSILESAGMRVLNVDFNQVNGGSFSINACKAESTHESDKHMLDWLLAQEDLLGLGSPQAVVETFASFSEKVEKSRHSTQSLFSALKSSNKSVAGLGASTKGNVLLQHFDIGPEDLPFIAEVNEYKFGRLTPGTRIPIVSEAEIALAGPDYLFVLPWHFRDAIIRRESEFLQTGGKLIFPLPEVEIVGI